MRHGLHRKRSRFRTAIRDEGSTDPGPHGHRAEARKPLSLRETLERANDAAWRGERVQPYFGGALEFASCRDCTLVFLTGQYVGEVSIDPESRRQCQPMSLLTVHTEFHPEHRLYFVSDPRRYAPGFANGLGMFPSLDTAALALLRVLARDGLLSRFRTTWSAEDDASLKLLEVSTASLACPWLRLRYGGRELAWLMVDRKRSEKEGRWFFVGPAALGHRRKHGYFQSSEHATLALVAALRRAHARTPERFETELSTDPSGPVAWNRVALELLRELETLPAPRADAPRRAG